MNKKLVILGTIIWLTLIHNSLSWARASKSNLEDRLELLESKIDSNLNLDLANKLEQLEKEVQELRGLVEEKQELAYREAYNLVEEKKFIEAIEVFKNFLAKYNDHYRVPDAIYWLGELYSTEHDFEIAANYFLQLINDYKNHIKAPDALFKLGMLEFDRENWQVAKDYFYKIKNNYPNSPRVHMAEVQLQVLARKGY